MEEKEEEDGGGGGGRCNHGSASEIPFSGPLGWGGGGGRDADERCVKRSIPSPDICQTTHTHTHTRTSIGPVPFFVPFHENERPRATSASVAKVNERKAKRGPPDWLLPSGSFWTLIGRCHVAAGYAVRHFHGRFSGRSIINTGKPGTQTR